MHITYLQEPCICVYVPGIQNGCHLRFHAPIAGCLFAELTVNFIPKFWVFVASLHKILSRVQKTLLLINLSKVYAFTDPVCKI